MSVGGAPSIHTVLMLHSPCHSSIAVLQIDSIEPRGLSPLYLKPTLMHDLKLPPMHHCNHNRTGPGAADRS